MRRERVAVRETASVEVGGVEPPGGAVVERHCHRAAFRVDTDERSALTVDHAETAVVPPCHYAIPDAVRVAARSEFQVAEAAVLTDEVTRKAVQLGHVDAS